MMKIVSVAASFAAIAAAGPRWGEKTCPEFDSMANVDLERYAGTWYEIVRDRATPFELMA